MAADGLSCEEVAERLVLSVNTVKTHLEHVYLKLGVHSRVQLARKLAESSEKSPERVIGGGIRKRDHVLKKRVMV